MEIKLNDKITIAIILILIALFSFIFLGFIGFKVIFGMLIVFFLPFYLILDNFDLSKDEKIFFAFFIGVGAFPAIVYWMGVFISFRLAILVTFVLFILVGLIIRKFKKRPFSSAEQKPQQQ